jgi:citryl-CoA synthetase large subunit
MNLYEFEGKQFFETYGISVPRGFVVRRGDDVAQAYMESGLTDVVVKAQVLSGKRGKNNGIRFCSSADDVVAAVADLFSTEIRGQYVAAVRIEEKLSIAEEQYVSITYDTNNKQPVIVYSQEGGVDIEDVSEEKIYTWLKHIDADHIDIDAIPAFGEELWQCFIGEDCRLVEINPLVKTTDGKWVAADAKVALDDDAFFRHTEKHGTLEPRTMMGRPPTEREVAVQEIDTGEKYYQGTAGKYIEMDGDIAILFSGGGASIANMDALMSEGLQPANYTEYSGNPPREKVHALAKIVLSKPGLRGLWIAGGVANFTNVKETFQGIVDALDEVKPPYPIVVRRAGPYEEEGMALMKACAERNGLNMSLFGKETSMSESATLLAQKVRQL